MNYSYIRDTICDFADKAAAGEDKPLMKYKADDSAFSLENLMRRQENGKAD